MNVRLWVCWLLCAAVCLCGCATAKVGGERGLSPGLMMLRSYSFDEETERGMRWLENHANANPKTTSGNEARYWLLRARLDWLTLAYVEEDYSERVRMLRALMREMGLGAESSGEAPGSEALFEMTERLAGHARGLGEVEGYEDVSRGAVQLLGVFQHLDMGAGYYDGINVLVEAYETSGGGARSGGLFAANAVLMASADLKSKLVGLSGYTLGRRVHVLARWAAYGCPAGFIGFGESSLEEREGALRQGCVWPCEGAAMGASRGEVVSACGESLEMGVEMFSLGNEVTARVLRGLKRLKRVAGELVSEGEGALVRRGETKLAWLSGLFSEGVYLLELPEYGGQLGVNGLALPELPYAQVSEASPLVLKWEGGVLSVGSQPFIRLRGGEVFWEMKAVSNEGDEAAWSERVKASLREREGRFMEEVGLSGEKVSPLNVVPKLIVGAAEESDGVKRLCRLLAARGHGFVDLVVSDPKLKRVGVIRFELLQREGVGLRLKLGARGWEMRDERRQRLGESESTAVLEALVSSSSLSSGGAMALELEGSVSVQRVVEVLGRLRYKREGGDVRMNGEGRAEALVSRVVLTL